MTTRPPGNPAQLVKRDDDEPLRYNEGWRRGKPQEDPSKLKPWGWISAKPSEFLIRMRGGQVLASGQGRTMFKWPWDSVAVVPTTVQRLQFSADQITIEKVGVKVTGIVVYRIAEPLIAFRMLNFSYPERAQEKLAEMMEEMCIGATRRLVANLPIEQCLTRRKDALSSELIREIAPVVSGDGRVEDSTSRGWGVVVDTIEIQDVRVTSSQVFANMQARFRQEQERIAREAELSKERAVKLDEASSEQQIELSRVAAQTEIRRQRQVADEEARLEKLTSEARVEAQRLEQEQTAKANAIATERQLNLAKIQAEQEVRGKKLLADDAAAMEKLQMELRLAQAQQRAAEQAALEKLQSETQLATARQLAAEKAAAEKLRAQMQLAEAQREADDRAAFAKLDADVQLAQAQQRAAEQAAMEALQAEVRQGQERLKAQTEAVRIGLETATARHAAQLAKETQQAEVNRAALEVAQTRLQLAELDAKTVEFEVAKQRLLSQLELDRAASFKQIENTLSAEAIQLVVANKLPELALAFQQKMGEVHVTAVDGANPFGYIAAAVEGVMGLARSAGLQTPAPPARKKE